MHSKFNACNTNAHARSLARTHSRTHAHTHTHTHTHTQTHTHQKQNKKHNNNKQTKQNKTTTTHPFMNSPMHTPIHSSISPPSHQASSEPVMAASIPVHIWRISFPTSSSCRSHAPCTVTSDGSVPSGSGRSELWSSLPTKQATGEIVPLFAR